MSRRRAPVEDAPPLTQPSPASAALRRWAPLLIVIAAVYAYSNATKGPFIFDDYLAIVNNASVRSLWPIWETLSPPGHVGTAGRPLVALSYALNYAFDGLNPRYYHAVNIALHVLCGLAMLGVVRRVLRRIDYRPAEPVAVIATLIWTVHPIHTDAVTYVINRTEVMMALFALLSVYTFLRSAESPHGRRWRVLSVVCAIASVCSKEVGAMIVPVIVILDALLVSRGWKQAFARHKWYYAGLLLTWIALPLLLATASGTVKTGGGGRLSSWTYLLMQTQVVLMYLKLTFWPSPLVLDYVDWPVPAGLGDVLPWAVALTALFALSVWLVVRRHPAGVIGAAFFLILAPSSSLLPLGSEPAAERRVYLPLVAVIPGVVLAAEWLMRRLRIPAKAGVVLAVVVVLVLGQATLWRNEDYGSALAIWTDNAVKRPGNPRAHGELGGIYKDAGQYEDALEAFETALKLAPGYADVRVNRAIVLSALGRDAEAMRDVDWILARDPNHYESMTFKAWLLNRQGRKQEAIALLEAVLRDRPHDLKARNTLADVRAALIAPTTQEAK